MTIYHRFVFGDKRWWVEKLKRHIRYKGIKTFRTIDVERWLSNLEHASDLDWFTRSILAERIVHGGGGGAWRRSYPGPLWRVVDHVT